MFRESWYWQCRQRFAMFVDCRRSPCKVWEDIVRVSGYGVCSFRVELQTRRRIGFGFGDVSTRPPRWPSFWGDCDFRGVGEEVVSMTTEIQEELFLKMGVDPKFGIDCLGKVNTVYANDRDLMIQFYQFVSREEMA